MHPVRRFLAAVCAAAAVSASLSIWPALHAQSASGIVISEFRVRGPQGGNDEFIELYNNSSAAIDIGGWLIKGSNNAGSVSTRVTIAANTVLKPGCYFLATNSGSSGYSGTVPGDQTYGTGITDDGGIAVVMKDAVTVVDQVGMSAGSAYKESTPLGSFGSANGDRSYKRRPFSPPYQDTNNNAADFQLSAVGNPQSKASCTSDPTGVGSALPGALDPGEATLLTVTVTPGKFPDSTGIAVVADLSAIGGLSTQSLVDDGTSGDAVAGDKTFSWLTTVAAGTTPGSKTLTVTIADAQNRSSALTIRIDVQQPVLPISAIQGSGLTSPHDGELVATRGVVTALRNNGFFIQTPDNLTDGDPLTSEGLFIFTSTAPAVSKQQFVQVTGRVQEFRPAGVPPITELSGFPTVALLDSGYALPSAAELDPSFTRADGGAEQLERFEGMRVTGNFEVVAPTASFSQSTTQEKNADPGNSRGEFYVVIRGVARPFREPGLEPGQSVPAGTSACCIPRFDGNPERIRVLSDGQTGALKLDVAGRQVLNGVAGVMDGSTTLLPDPGAAIPPAAFVAVPAPSEGEFTIGSFNMERFYDTEDDADVDDVVLTAAAFERRLSKASLAIRDVLRLPDIIGAVEIDNINALRAIAQRVNADSVATAGINPGYAAYLEEGNDIGGIDVGFLVKTSRVNVVTVTQIGQDATFTQPDGAVRLLNDRPSLVLEADIIGPAGDPYPVTVIVNHLRSLSSIDDPADGERVRAKRRAQAEFLADYIQARQLANPRGRIVSVGDYNAFQFNDGYVDSIGTIKGTPTDADHVLLPSDDVVNPDLTNLVELAPATERYSFAFAGNPQLLDHVLANAPMTKRHTRLAFGRSNADFPESFRAAADRPERLSDHDAPVAYFAFPSAPVVTLNGDADMSVEAFTGTYNEPGAVAVDTDGSWPVSIHGSVDVTTPGDYDVAYSASNGYVTTTVHRTVHVRDTVKPAITGFSLTPDSLWSPNHKLVDVVAQYSVTDASNRAACSLTAGSNELANDLGDGNTAVDVVVATCTICSCGRARARGTLATLTWTDSSGNVVSLSTSLSMMNDE